VASKKMFKLLSDRLVKEFDQDNIIGELDPDQVKCPNCEGWVTIDRSKSPGIWYKFSTVCPHCKKEVFI